MSEQNETTTVAAQADPAKELVKFRFFDETTPQHLQKPGVTFPVTYDGRREDLEPGKWYTLRRGFLENLKDATHPVLVKQREIDDSDADMKAGESREISTSGTARRFRIEQQNPSPGDIAEAMGAERRKPGRPKTRVA